MVVTPVGQAVHDLLLSGEPDKRKEKALRNWRLCQCSNGLFPIPLACLCCGHKGVFVADIHNACTLSDIRCFQKRKTTFVGGDGFEMAESIAHEIDCGAFLRQSLCAFIGEDN